jgi:hypothetical protein
MSNAIPIQPDLAHPVQISEMEPSFNPYTPSDSPTLTNIKLSTLLVYTPAQVRDTWLSMGQLEINNDSRVYTRNSVFRCVEATAPLNGCIFYCDADYTTSDNFTWTNMMVADITSGTIIDNTTYIVDPHFYIVLTQAAFLAITADFDPTFIPFQEVNTNSKVIIDDDDLNQILMEIGVPFIKIAELEYSRDDICNYMVLPALKIFYKWFPIETVANYGLPTSSFKIPIPRWSTGPLRAFVNPGFPITNTPQNPLYRYFDEVLMSISPRALSLRLILIHQGDKGL